VIGHKRIGIAELKQAIAGAQKPPLPAWPEMDNADDDPMLAEIESRYQWIERVAEQCVPNQKRSSERSMSTRVDAILIHRVWGVVIFAAIMGALFFTIFRLAQPIMNGIQDGIQMLGERVVAHVPAGPVHDLINNGIFAGVGAVLVFVPQIALLFMFLSILEDSGYLARAAFLMDRLLAKVGLHGKSFIPLLSSFACAIPGIMATRTIENRKDRLATILVAPFMSCSARLPVYTLLIGTFFAAYGAMTQAGILLAMYVVGILAAVVTAWIFRRTLLKGPAEAFILELPTYKVPQFSEVARQVWVNTSEFLKKAGTVIFCMSVLLWALTYYGISHQSLAQLKSSGATTETMATARLNDSFAAHIGHVLEPAIKPLGYNWKMGVGLISAFTAREVFVSTMGIVYTAGDTDTAGTATLSARMQADRYANGENVWTPRVAVSLLIWFVLAMQCMSTLAVVRRETGGWAWPIFMLVYMNALAYVVCFSVFQLSGWI
ncbi:MAG TPA: ferrous iron transport protein B, partial [Tepidisphaeraceae bacterium]|nr:ferrous iron transport protein B [Tepidisphaeraceae bacterium]